jgi:hypothetical protein
MDVNPNASAVREIIDDALNGRRVFAESTEQTAQPEQADCKIAISLTRSPDKTGDLYVRRQQQDFVVSESICRFQFNPVATQQPPGQSLNALQHFLRS